MRPAWMLTALVAGTSAPAHATDYLTAVVSEVYQATGTQREIATRGRTCIAQHLAAGAVDADLIVSADLEGGTIVARNAIEYSETLMRWRLRSVFTFQARDGRFRIEQTNLERFNSTWGPIGKWAGSGWRRAEAAYATSAQAVATCVVSGPRTDVW